MPPAITSIQPERARCPCGMRLRVWERGGGRVVSRGGRVKESPGILRTLGGVSHIVAVFFGFLGGPPPKRGDFKASPGPRPPPRETPNKTEPTAAPALRTKMSKADASRAVEALFDDKGIIAGELKKGAKVQITGFGNFEARKRAARMGRNPKTGGVIQIKASIAPAFRAGKQLKMAVNNRK